MKEETLAPAVGFGLMLQKTEIMSGNALNLQTPHLPSRKNSEFSDNRITL
jgi:hypothetical protein